jgi:hypothetical protein
MAGLVPAIYVFSLKAPNTDVDARDNPRIKSGDGHDAGEVTRSLEIILVDGCDESLDQVRGRP